MKPVPLLFALSLLGCATAPVPASDNSTASIGQVAIVNGLRIRPTRLMEDSRCPASVQCVWAGRVRLLVDATRGDGLYAERVLTLGEPQNIEWGMLTLLAVHPPKMAPGATDPQAYRFTFSFER